MHIDLTQGQIKDHLIKLAVPSIVGYFFHTMFNVTDTYFAGTISTEALAALSLSASIFFMILAFGIGMSEAVTSLVGNALGEKKIHEAKNIIGNAIAFSIMLSIFLSVSGLLSIPLLLGALGDDSYNQETYHYINIVLYGCIIFILVFFINSVLNALGDTKSLRNVLIFTTFLNVFLDYIFIEHFHFGVQSIAIATIICELIALLYLFYKFKQTKLYCHFSDFTYDFTVIKSLISHGVPPSINLFMMAFGMYVTMYFIAPFGKEAIAAFGIGMRIEQIFLMPIVGLNIAALAMISQNNGAKEYKRIKPTLHLAIKYAWIFSFIGVTSFYLFSDFYASLLTKDILVIAQVSLYLKVAGIASFAFAVIFIYIAMLQGIKQPSIITPISIYRQVLAPAIIFYFLLMYKLDIFYFWLTLDVVIFSSAIFLWWYGEKKLNMLK